MSKGRLASLVKKVALGVGGLIALLALATGVFIYRLDRASTRIHEFCDSVQVGETIQAVHAKVTGAGLSATMLPQGDREPSNETGTLLIQDGVAMARQLCSLDVAEGRIVAKDRSFLD